MTATPGACLMCGSSSLRPLFDGVRDHYGIATTEYRFVRCGRCCSAILDPLPPPDTLQRFYPDEYTFKQPESSEPFLRRALRGLEWHAFYQPIYRKRVRAFRRLTGLVSGRVIEVGCGSGLFLRALASAGYAADGVETSDADVFYARRRLRLSVFHGQLADFAMADDSYDAAFLVYVLEHVPSPGETLRAVHRILRPGGWVLAGLPVIDSIQGRLLGRRWSQVTEAPRHLSLPSDAGARWLLTAAGFVDVRSTPMPLIDNAGAIALSVLPGAATTRAYRSTGVGALMARRWAGALLMLPALGVALAERLPWSAGPRAGLMLYCARKPGGPR